MRRLQCALLSTVAVIGFTSIVSAADLPVKAPTYKAPAAGTTPNDWTGFYVGLNAGGAWGRSSTNTSIDCATAVGYICNSGLGAADAAAVNASGSGSITDSGFTGGIQAGYNWQINNFVYGLETDFGAFKLNGSTQVSGLYPGGGRPILTGRPYTVGSSFNTDWLFTFRGRLGFALPSNLLAYATGGLALTKLGITNSFSDVILPGAAENASGSGQKTGWTVGGGLEWALNKHWTVKGEYLFLDFGKVTTSGIIRNGGAYAQGISTSSDLTVQVARLGVNYKF